MDIRANRKDWHTQTEGHREMGYRKRDINFAKLSLEI